MTDQPKKSRKRKILAGRLTNRGFVYFSFKDANNCPCSLQKSSAGDEDCLWLGIEDEKNTLSVSPRRHPAGPNDSGRWEKLGEAYPEIDTIVGGRMHLTREMAAELAPKLDYFARTGRLRAPRRTAAQIKADAENES